MGFQITELNQDTLILMDPVSLGFVTGLIAESILIKLDPKSSDYISPEEYEASLNIGRDYFPYVFRHNSYMANHGYMNTVWFAVQLLHAITGREDLGGFRWNSLIKESLDVATQWKDRHQRIQADKYGDHFGTASAWYKFRPNEFVTREED